MELGTFVSGQLANKNREEQLKLDKEAHEMEMKKQRELQQQEQEAHEAKMKREKEELELDKERRAAKKEELDLLEKELKLKEQFKVLEKVRVYLTGITVSCQCVGICHVFCSPFFSLTTGCGAGDIEDTQDTVECRGSFSFPPSGPTPGGE